MTKSFVVLFVLIFSILALQAFNTNPQPKWKNLQILPDNISEQALDSIMDHFTNSLSVKCTYCHVRNEQTTDMDFASDDKIEKIIARGMMNMSIDINKDHFAIHDDSAKNPDGSLKDTARSGYLLKYVTCYTCHHGSAHPKGDPPVEKKR